MKEKITIKDVVKEYTDVFFLKDTTVIPLICAVTIGTKVKGDPVWLMLIGASSGGKSELINIISEVPFAHQVSTLTENTFLSGLNATKGKEPSLLHKIGNVGMITMKDYTSILSMRPDKRDVIISQMREIFDGYITKKTGNSNDPEWKGKLNFLGGVTDKIYMAEESSAGMGRRAIFYSLPDFNDEERISMTMASRCNLFDIKEKRKRIADLTKKFILQTIEDFPKDLPKVDDDLAGDIMELSNFVTVVRTPTERDYRGVLRLAIRPELPTRMSSQLFMIATILNILDGRELDYHKDIIYKIALDSIPIQRRMVLQELATYKHVTLRGLSEKIHYPTETVLEWLEDLTVLKACYRPESYGIAGPDKYIIKDRYRDIMTKYDNIEYTKEDLLDDGEEVFNEQVDPAFMVDSHDKGSKKEMQRNANEAAQIWGSFE